MLNVISIDLKSGLFIYIQALSIPMNARICSIALLCWIERLAFIVLYAFLPFGSHPNEETSI